MGIARPHTPHAQAQIFSPPPGRRDQGAISRLTPDHSTATEASSPPSNLTLPPGPSWDVRPLSPSPSSSATLVWLIGSVPWKEKEGVGTWDFLTPQNGTFKCFLPSATAGKTFSFVMSQYTHSHTETILTSSLCKAFLHVDAYILLRMARTELSS